MAIDLFVKWEEREPYKSMLKKLAHVGYTECKQALACLMFFGNLINGCLFWFTELSHNLQFMAHNQLQWLAVGLF